MVKTLFNLVRSFPLFISRNVLEMISKLRTVFEKHAIFCVWTCIVFIHIQNPEG